MASEIVSCGNQTGEGWFLTGEMLELIHSGAANIVCTQPFACLPNHIVGKGVIKELRRGDSRKGRYAKRSINIDKRPQRTIAAINAPAIPNALAPRAKRTK